MAYQAFMSPKYDAALQLMQDGKYEEAISAFNELNNYLDSADKIAECNGIILNQKYDAAAQLQNSGNYEEAIAAYEALNGYNDSANKIIECQNSILELQYLEAKALQDKGNYKDAIALYEALDGYNDSANKIIECQNSILELQYLEAKALQDNGNYEDAIAAYEALDGYSDSEDRIIECQSGILELQYQEARALQDSGNYEDAITAYKALNGYSDSADRIVQCQTSIKESTYQQAMSCYQNGDYVSAYNLLLTIPNYKDVDNLIATDEHIAEAIKEINISNFKTVGNYVTFGTYEQDGKTKDGAEPIEWLVLDVNGDSVLLISKYGLDAKPYNEKSAKNVTWKSCTLRKWLNDSFYKTAFTSNEQKAIITTEVDNSSSQCNPTWNSKGGNNTKDKIFLLSYAEAKKYFNMLTYASENIESRMHPTAYAKRQGAYIYSKAQTLDGMTTGMWWLRSPGYTESQAMYVSCAGTFANIDVANSTYCVRPALWINLKSAVFQ